MFKQNYATILRNLLEQQKLLTCLMQMISLTYCKRRPIMPLPNNIKDYLSKARNLINCEIPHIPKQKVNEIAYRKKVAKKIYDILEEDRMLKESKIRKF